MEQKLDLAQEIKLKSLKQIKTEFPTSSLCRKAAAEGIILLKNDGVLPLRIEDRVAVFGRSAFDYQSVGYGSGGDVAHPYVINIWQGLKNNSVLIDAELEKVYMTWIQEHAADAGVIWGKWPMSFEEMEISKEDVIKYRNRNDVALIVLGRVAGEDRDNKLEEGSYYLTKKEKQLIQNVTASFEKVVVILNIGNPIDLSFLDQYTISSVILPWQGGMEGGNAIADVLTGRINPCGRLSMTLANKYEDYPSKTHFGHPDFDTYEEDIFVGYRYFNTFAENKIRYPFGFGLSYTHFAKQIVKIEAFQFQLEVTISIKNVGKYAGKEVIELYLGAPQGCLGKASKVLCGFTKTKKLAVAEQEIVKISINLKDFASYDDIGSTGYKNCYVLEPGDYKLYLGDHVSNCKEIYSYSLKKLELVLKVEEAMAPKQAFSRFVAKTKDDIVYLDKELTPVATLNLEKRVLDNLPKKLQQTKNLGITLWDVKEGKYSLDAFIAQLTDEELELLTRGYGPMNSPYGLPGNAGSFGGSSKALQDMGIPAIITTDGPSGIRLERISSLLPSGVLLASTFDVGLIESLYKMIAEEMLQRKTDVLLAPGMNLHRNPLCGRNFEYFSEDPFLSGHIGASVVKGIQQEGLSACCKHFACNHQEYRRNYWDARVSERALREIYLRNFEICIRESHPNCIMTSYNKINGVWSHYNYEMVQMILYDEWHYQGCVLTDWWMQYSASKEFPQIKGDAYRVRAHVNVLMPGQTTQHPSNRNSDGSLLESLSCKEGITRGEIEKVVKDVLKLAMHSTAFLRNKRTRR